ncbi:response regulator [Enterobacter sp. 168J2]|uniref:response regulator n=1 Tax=Enterobacter sp. 168J2 TaxID=3077758 RepID=UPI00124AA193|nr:response regulator transcription factor [Enterobacter sp. 168J2]EJC0565558.1 response regulator transcription factor [Enterobacter cloacae]MCP1115429.1 response regulator transcription factor [Enterobacter bugandensis]HBU6132868.1 response regulator transcription factor [Enterobacter cloacae]
MGNNPLNRTRIVIIDDQAIALHGMYALLNKPNDFQVVGRYVHSSDLLAELASLDADVLVMDFALAPDDMDGISLLRLLQTQYPTLAILVISAIYNSATVLLALHAGAKGFISKSMHTEELARAVGNVASGQIHLMPEMALELTQLFNTELTQHLPPFGNSAKQPSLDFSLLSPREQEVIQCFIDGMSVSEIADKFKRSIKTISGQKQTAMRKLGFSSDRSFLQHHNALNGSSVPLP